MGYSQKEQKWSNQFAWNLSRLCYKKKIKMETLFLNLGLSIREKNRIMKGHNPTFHKICKIAEGLKVDPSELLDFKIEKTTPYKGSITIIKEPVILKPKKYPKAKS